MSAICSKLFVTEKGQRLQKKDLPFIKPLNEDQQTKRKTEICKNYQAKGSCRFSVNCSFAHGETELRDKTLRNQSLKTKPCKNFHKAGACPYGTRCSYLHSEIKEKIKWWGFLQKLYKKQTIPYTFALNRQERSSKEERIDVLRFQRIFSNYIGVTQLPFFKNLCV